MRHWHTPERAEGRSYVLPGHPVPIGTVPFEPKERGECFRCGKPIVFVQGYEMRRDYWRLVSK